MGGPNTTVNLGPGVRLLRGSKYYVTSLHPPCYNIPVITDIKATVERAMLGSVGDGGDRTGSNCGGSGERATLGCGGDGGGI